MNLGTVLNQADQTKAQARCVADKGYDSDAFVQTISAQGSQAVIPPRSNRLNPRTRG